MTTPASAVYAVIMAGGAGTRFWPASRSLTPKQLLPLGGGTEALLAATVRRLGARIPADRIYIATGAHLLDATAKVVPEIPRANLLAEPVPRNTAPCIGWATHVIARRDPNAIVAVFPADHFIADEEGFIRCLDDAIGGAERGHMTTVGIVPTRPETGYGYIERGEVIAGAIHRVQRFVEKPSRERAEIYLREGNYLWNAGMFFFRARLMMDAITDHLPDLGLGLAQIDEAAVLGTEQKVLGDVFPTLPSISIDHGVMEKEGNLAVVPASFGWNDVGSWQSTWELSPKDPRSNAMPEGAVAVDAAGNLVSDLRTTGKKRVYAFVGVSDLVLVETDDAVLLIPRERAQDVRAVVDALKARGATELL
ncbi:mannose-1-phosphate guanylyltransferase [soil metagenome]